MNRDHLVILAGDVIIAAGLLVVSGKIEGGANIHPNTRQLQIGGIKYTVNIYCNIYVTLNVYFKNSIIAL